MGASPNSMCGVKVRWGVLGTARIATVHVIPAIQRAAHAEVIDALDALLRRAQATGSVRTDVGAVDLLFLLKGVCEAAGALSQIEPMIVQRHLDLVHAALVPPVTAAPLRGRAPTLSDIEQAFPSAPAPEVPVRAVGERSA